MCLLAESGNGNCVPSLCCETSKLFERVGLCSNPVPAGMKGEEKINSK